MKHQLTHVELKTVKYAVDIGQLSVTCLLAKQIRLIEPVVGSEEKQLVEEVLNSGWLSEGPMTRRFEELLANFVGAKFAVAATSCTTAMEIALRAMGIRAGDRVIVPDFTHPATADAVICLGANPILADVKFDSYNIDFEQATAAVAKGAKAIMPVSWGGYPLDKKEVDKLKELGVRVLEDAACSVGSEFQGHKTGSMGDMTCFSFHPRKVLTTGEGGAVTTDNQAYAEQLRSLKNFGMGKEGDKTRFIRYGTNYKMSDILAAVGVAQMAKLPRIIERRIELAGFYDKLLSEVDGIRAPERRADVKHTYQTYAAYVEVAGARDKLIRDLKASGIEAQIGTYALHLEPYYRNLERQGDLLNSKLLYENLIALPMSHNMTSEDQEHVVAQVQKSLKQFGR